MEKKLPQTLAAVVKPVEVRERSVRVMFQDEARFGRMARPRRCWAPLPCRPVMLNGYERQFMYVYGAVSPLQGELDSIMLYSEMNTVRMGEFLGQVSRTHPEDFIVMILDWASWHKAKTLVGTREYPLGRAAPMSRAQSAGARVGRTARERVSQPGVQSHGCGHRTVARRVAALGSRS